MHLSFFCKYLPKVSQGILRDFSGDIFKTVPGKSAARDVPKHVPRNILCEISPEFFYIIFLGDICHKLPWGSLLSDIPKENPWIIFWVRAKNTSVFCEISPKRRVNYIILWEISRKKSFWKTDFGDDSPQQKSIFLVGCPLQGSLKNIFSVRSVFKAYLAKYLLEDAWEILSREVSSVFTPKKVFSLNSNRCVGPCIKGLGGTQHPRSPNSAQINSSLVWPRILLKHRKLLLGLPGIYTP